MERIREMVDEMLMQANDNSKIEEAESVYSYYKNGGGKGYRIPKSGKQRDICMRGMGRAVGQMQGYLLALREHGIITYDEWHNKMEQYVYNK